MTFPSTAHDIAAQTAWMISTHDIDQFEALDRYQAENGEIDEATLNQVQALLAEHSIETLAIACEAAYSL